MQPDHSPDVAYVSDMTLRDLLWLVNVAYDLPN